MPQRTRNPRGEGSRLRDEILDSAVALIDETNDPRALTLRGIARRAGISAPPIYSHFEDLPSLIEATLSRSFEELRASVTEAIASTDDPVSALLAAGRAYVQFGWQHRARYQLMFNAHGYADNAVETFTVVENLIARCAATGHGHSVDPHLDAWILWAGMHGVATLEKPARSEYRRLGALDRPALLDTMVRRLARIEEAPTE